MVLKYLILIATVVLIEQGVSIQRVLAGTTNLLLKKPVFVTDYKHIREKSNDGDVSSCMWIRKMPMIYLVFDTEKYASIEKVVMKTGGYEGKEPFRVYVGDEFQPCHFHKQLPKYKLCASDIIQNKRELNISCTNGPIQGRYVALIKGNFFSKVNAEPLNFCEFEAYGTVVRDAEKISRPKIPSKVLKPADKSLFKISSELRKNLEVVSVYAYSKALVKINKNCEPAIWETTYNLTYSFACLTESKKGRAMFFGSEWYFWYKIFDKTTTKYKDSFFKFLSPNNPEPRYLATTKFTSVEELRKQVRDGDIVDFYTYNVYPDEFVTELLQMVEDGRISLVVDHKNTVTDEKILRSVRRVMEYFGISFDSTYFAFSSGGDFPIKDSDYTEAFLDTETRLERFLVSHELMMATGDSFIKNMEKIPSHIEVNHPRLGALYKQLVEKYNDLLEFVCPCRNAPTADLNDRLLVKIIDMFLQTQSMANSGYKAPCVDLFPGDFREKPAAAKPVTLELFGDVAYTRNPVGYYLPPGSTLEYEVVSKEGDWMASVGCATDRLTDNRPEWLRYPDVFIDNIGIQTGSGKVYSPFGGALWLTNNQANSTLRLRLLSGVVASPFFNLHDADAVEQWDQVQSKNPGPWTQLSGQDMVICGLSSEITQFSGKTIHQLMVSWDKVVRNNRAYGGYDWRAERPEQTVLDIQTSAGYAHSGYPVSTFDDWYVNVVNMTYILAEGSWGMCHELGHNRQESVWNFGAVSETTNNIFCLLNFEKVWKKEYYGKTRAQLTDSEFNTLKTYLDGGADFSAWSASTTLSLFTYVHLTNSFGHGFHAKVFKYYRDHSEKTASSNAEKIALWIEVTSIVTGMNLAPLYDFWGWPVDGAAVGTGASYFPDDYITQASPSRTKYVLDKYSGCTRTSVFHEDYNADSFNSGDRPNFIRKI